MGANFSAVSPFPFANANEIKGAPIIVQSIAEMFGYPLAYRQYGQYCHVLNPPAHVDFDPIYPTPANFQFQNVSSDDLADNDNWIQISFASLNASRAYIATLSPGDVDYPINHNLDNEFPHAIVRTNDLLSSTITGFTEEIIDENNLILHFGMPAADYKIKIVA